MITFPTLYARTSTGAVQIWFMEVDGDSYRSTSGQIDGVKTVSEFTKAESKNSNKKNSTTPEQQAIKEVKNKYKKQLKSGGYWENINGIDTKKYFECMLALSFEDHESKINWADGVGVQIKYNGGRIIANREGLFTRKGERYTCIPHIEEALKPFFVKFPNAVLDGEGFNYEYRQNLKEIMKLLRKNVHASPADIARSKELIKFYVYDGFGFGASENDCYLKRKQSIDFAFHNLKFSWRWKNIIGFVPTHVVFSKKSLDAHYQLFLKDKQEGAIIRILGIPYQNKRTDYLLKYKPVDDAEYKIIKVIEGKGNWFGLAAKVTCQRIDGRKFLDGTDSFNATVKGTKEEKREVLKNAKDYVGKIKTIYYNGLTGYGKPNFAQFDVKNSDKGH